jgi:hypothetical protein
MSGLAFPLAASRLRRSSLTLSRRYGDVAPCIEVERYGRRPVANLNAPSAESVARSVRSGSHHDGVE